MKLPKALKLAGFTDKCRYDKRPYFVDANGQVTLVRQTRHGTWYIAGYGRESDSFAEPSDIRHDNVWCSVRPVLEDLGCTPEAVNLVKSLLLAAEAARKQRPKHRIPPVRLAA